MRTVNSFKNLITGVFGRVLYMVLNFVVRTVFIATLSENYLGVNGLLGSVLSVLSLTELGEMTDPPLSKSGVNNRMRRLMAIAEELEKEGEA